MATAPTNVRGRPSKRTLHQPGMPPYSSVELMWDSPNCEDYRYHDLCFVEINTDSLTHTPRILVLNGAGIIQGGVASTTE